METKTDMEADIHLTVQPTMTVGEVHKEVERKMGWLPTSQLKRCAWHPPSCCLFVECPGRCMVRVVASGRYKRDQLIMSQWRSSAQSLPFTAATHSSLGVLQQLPCGGRSYEVDWLCASRTWLIGLLNWRGTSCSHTSKQAQRTRLCSAAA